MAEGEANPKEYHLNAYTQNQEQAIPAYPQLLPLPLLNYPNEQKEKEKTKISTVCHRPRQAILKNH